MHSSLHSCPVICNIRNKRSLLQKRVKEQSENSRRDTLMTDAQTKTEKGPSLREINQSPGGQETLFTKDKVHEPP